MRRCLVAVAVAAGVLLAGCGSDRQPDEVYEYVCLTYSMSPRAMPSVASSASMTGLMERYGLSRKDAADAIDVALREYCH